ncbi:MAG: 50S ribosomal protein L23 [bacterium]
MAILDIFKKKKKEAPKEKPETLKKKPVVKKEEKPVERAEKKVLKPKEKKTKGISFNVLKSPHVTEKASDLTRKNQYIFKVWPRSNKIEIKRAVEDLFGVDVTAVRIINIHKKARRVGKTQGFRTGYKKAIVCLAKGQKIEILPR